MSTIAYRPPHLSEAGLRALLKEALENGNGPENPETFHARYDHVERGLTLDDVIHGLEHNWTYERSPEFNEVEWQWKYRLATETIEGDPLTILIAIDTRNRSFEVITRWKR
jgi:hypothetical protein